MQPLLTIGQTPDLVDAIRSARHVELDAYVLRNPFLLFALEQAAGRGAAVSVRFGDPPDALQRKSNLDAMEALQAAGARVEIVPGYGPQSTHDKVAVVDGVLYRDDRNFTADQSETILIDRRPDAARHYATIKSQALDEEAKLIATSRSRDLLVSTEALGAGKIVDALLSRAQGGAHVRLMYDSSTHDPDPDLIARLRTAGVEMRDAKNNHKAAIAGDAAWLGSANATSGSPGMHDWGTTLHGAPVAALRETLEYCWSAAKEAADAANSSVHGNPRA
jgi:phosphatidylserine/phosphatidylglycerophosphate/cardiolipin synthase-like enzyme